MGTGYDMILPPHQCILCCSALTMSSFPAVNGSMPVSVSEEEVSAIAEVRTSEEELHYPASSPTIP